ncbi:hypothetical protein Hanom_Chr07g00611181 [Helianthus anomalus]
MSTSSIAAATLSPAITTGTFLSSCFCSKLLLEQHSAIVCLILSFVGGICLESRPVGFDLDYVRTKWIPYITLLNTYHLRRWKIQTLFSSTTYDKH